MFRNNGCRIPKFSKLILPSDRIVCSKVKVTFGFLKSWEIKDILPHFLFLYKADLY